MQNLGFVGVKKQELDLCGDRTLKILKNKDGKALRGFPGHIWEHPGVQRAGDHRARAANFEAPPELLRPG